MRSPADAPPARVIVLAAGRGRRMGGPKALMLVGGRPWWRTQQGRLLDAGCDPLWVVSPAVRGALEHEPDPPAALVTADPDRPMFDSLRAAIHYLAADLPSRVFVLPVDVPAPDAATFRLLAGGTGTGVAVPVHAGRSGHPVCLSRDWIVRVLMPRVASRRDGERLDALIGPDRVTVAVADPAVVVNLNTPEDAARWAGPGV